MANKRGNSRPPGKTPPRNHTPITLRQEATGVKPTARKDGGVVHNPKSMLKLEHLQRVASWASREGAVPSLAAFFGRRLAAGQEALAVVPDPSLITCQRCETLLQPGYNCTVRIEKSRAKNRRRSKKPRISTQNNVVYSCQFCLHRNLKRGTPKGHMKVLHPEKAISNSQKKSKKAVRQTSSTLEIGTARGDESSKISLPGFSASEAVTPDDKLSSPVSKPSLELLSESKRWKRNRSAAKKPAEPEGGPASAESSVGSSKKRRRKSWTTLKEIAERSENGIGKNISGLKIPFLI